MLRRDLDAYPRTTYFRLRGENMLAGVTHTSERVKICCAGIFLEICTLCVSEGVCVIMADMDNKTRAHDIVTRGNEGQVAESKLSSQMPVAGITLALVLAAAAFFSGVHIGTGTQLEARVNSIFTSSKAEEVTDLSQFWSVWKLLDDRFVSASTTDPVSEEDRINGAIEGLVQSYNDPYTVYLPPDDSAIFEGDIAGNFSGVGMEVGMREGVITVIAPLPNTPAEKSGVRAGDAIVRIDGASTEGMSIDEAVKRIRGEKGTDVVFTIYRDGQEEFQEITVTRDTIDIPTVETEIRDDVFIVRLFNFSAVSESKFEEALRSYVRSGKRKLVLDLRGNPGGYLQSAVNIASYFLPTGKVVVRENFGEGKAEHAYRSVGRLLGASAPDGFVVLVDGGSASASEILAGALKEHAVATVMGMQTFGKGSVQELVSLPGNASLKVTVARWLTPDGHSISTGGLAPDIEVQYSDEDGKDSQLEAAIEYLNR